MLFINNITLFTIKTINNFYIFVRFNMFLGLDQSYTSSGFCVVNDTGEVVDFGTFKTEKTADVYDRAIQVAKFVSEKIIKHAINSLHIEGLAFGIRGDATRDLAGLLFTIITHIKMNHPTVQIGIIAPTSLKKFATGSGKADKKAMIAAVPTETISRFSQNFKKTTGLADICDAYFLATFR